VLVVDGVNGNDEVASRYAYSPRYPDGNVDPLNDTGLYKFKTIAQARLMANPGTTIVVYPGSYAANDILKNGVRWHFMPGAVVTSTTKPIFRIDESRQSAHVVTGHGRFFQSNDNLIQVKPEVQGRLWVEAESFSSLNSHPMMKVEGGEVVVTSRNPIVAEDREIIVATGGLTFINGHLQSNRRAVYANGGEVQVRGQISVLTDEQPPIRIEGVEDNRGSVLMVGSIYTPTSTAVEIVDGTSVEDYPTLEWRRGTGHVTGDITKGPGGAVHVTSTLTEAVAEVILNTVSLDVADADVYALTSDKPITVVLEGPVASLTDRDRNTVSVSEERFWLLNGAIPPEVTSGVAGITSWQTALGLGTAAYADSGSQPGQVLLIDQVGSNPALPPLDASKLYGIPALTRAPLEYKGGIKNNASTSLLIEGSDDTVIGLSDFSLRIVGKFTAPASAQTLFSTGGPNTFRIQVSDSGELSMQWVPASVPLDFNWFVDGKTHDILITADRDGDLTLYVDGAEVIKSDISAESSRNLVVDNNLQLYNEGDYIHLFQLWTELVDPEAVYTGGYANTVPAMDIAFDTWRQGSTLPIVDYQGTGTHTLTGTASALRSTSDGQEYDRLKHYLVGYIDSGDYPTGRTFYLSKNSGTDVRTHDRGVATDASLRTPWLTFTALAAAITIQDKDHFVFLDGDFSGEGVSIESLAVYFSTENASVVFPQTYLDGTATFVAEGGTVSWVETYSPACTIEFFNASVDALNIINGGDVTFESSHHVATVGGGLTSNGVLRFRNSSSKSLSLEATQVDAVNSTFKNLNITGTAPIYGSVLRGCRVTGVLEGKVQCENCDIHNISDGSVTLRGYNSVANIGAAVAIDNQGVLDRGSYIHPASTVDFSLNGTYPFSGTVRGLNDPQQDSDAVNKRYVDALTPQIPRGKTYYFSKGIGSDARGSFPATDFGNPWETTAAFNANVTLTNDDVLVFLDGDFSGDDQINVSVRLTVNAQSPTNHSAPVGLSSFVVSGSGELYQNGGYVPSVELTDDATSKLYSVYRGRVASLVIGENSNAELHNSTLDSTVTVADTSTLILRDRSKTVDVVLSGLFSKLQSYNSESGAVTLPTSGGFAECTLVEAHADSVTSSASNDVTLDSASVGNLSGSGTLFIIRPSTTFQYSYAYAIGKLESSLTVDSDATHLMGRSSGDPRTIDLSFNGTFPFSGTVRGLNDPQQDSDAANKRYVDSAAIGLLEDRGNYDASTNSPNLTSPAPGEVNKGYVYVVSFAGNSFFSEPLEAGDVLRALQDDPSNLGDWAITQSNMTASSVKTLYETNLNTNAFTDFEKTKLALVEPNADVTDATNVEAAGAVMEGDAPDAHSILVADTAANPVGKVIGTGSLVGRLPGGNVRGLNASEVKALLGLVEQNLPGEVGVAASDETTGLSSGTAVQFRMPYQLTLSEVRKTLNTATSGGDLVVDVNQYGSSIFSSGDASVPAGSLHASSSAFAQPVLYDNAPIRVDIDSTGSTTAGAGLKMWLIGTRQTSVFVS